MESSFSFALLLLILINIALSSCQPFFNYTSDQYALLAFKNSITLDPYDLLSKNWSSNTSFCYWIGVSCSNKHQRVTELNVSSFELRGTIAPHIGNLTFLQYLDISSNNFTGFIPSELSNLHRLKEINLAGNQITGSIPSGMFNISSLIEINMRYNKLTGKLSDNICGNVTPQLKRIYLTGNQLYGKIPVNIYKCTELEDLRLPMNQFSGKIPSEIGSLSMLNTLSLYSNDFKGDIPKEIGNLTSLKYLYLSDNNLIGELPKEIGNLPVLENFSVFNNSLSGSIPSSIFNISSLKSLELSFNEFSGRLPSNMGLSLSNLERLQSSYNNFSGPIPSSVTNASKLTHLDMGRNLLSGSIPNFGNLRLLQVLFISENGLSGEGSPNQELGFLSSLTNCRNMQHLQISNNPLNGVLPASIGNLSTFIRIFRASGCNIKGGIPSEIGNLSSLLHLFLDGNQIIGVIPTEIGKLKQLERMDLGSNQLQGYIPKQLCQMTNLGDLRLSGNMLSGSIPECLGQVKSLRIILLNSNKLNSTIPSNFWNLRDLIYLSLSSNYLNGHLSSQVGNLKAINLINLSSNQFLGNIPSLIDGCQSLEYLYLSNNFFRGSIPLSLGNIRGLKTLDLSKNNLSGLIPNSLGDIRLLEHFNVSYNKLEGKIPNGGCFINFTAQSFVHNSALCGASRFQVPPCSENYERPKSLVQFIKYGIPSLIVAIILAIVMLILMRMKNQKRIPLHSGISLGIEWRRISYRELERGTTSFSETNLLGRGSFGSVFKGTLLDGLNVAVKVFKLHSEGAARSFDTESEILSTIRHRNIVRIFGCCSNTEFKALILEYMPNGSLEKWLYCGTYCLDLFQRINVAMDVASALEYLHHGHIFPVVHCDIKPSNVLLDEDMTAHVGDFGIAKLFDSGETMVQTTTLATIGYAAPEYGRKGKVSTNGDVYSYGILLLEMFTGKKPTDDMFTEEISLKEWVSKALQRNATVEGLAHSLLSREDENFAAKQQCILSIFELAMKCLCVPPEQRINMIQAGIFLHKIKASFVEDTMDNRTRF